MGATSQSSGDLPPAPAYGPASPCLLTPNGAAADEVPLPSTRLYSPLAIEELSHSMSLLSPNMSHTGS